MPLNDTVKRLFNTRLMNRLRFHEQSFGHGVFPDENKARTEHLSIQRIPFCRRFVLPLDQHLGVPSRPLVDVGSRVDRGQLIAEPGAFISTALHSPVSGWVRTIDQRRRPDGRLSMAIEIEADPYATQHFQAKNPIDWRSLSLDEFINHIQHAGLVGMGGAAFPTHVKYSLPTGKRIEHLVVNGAECEPYLSCDHRLMVERPEALLSGTEIVRQKLGAARATIGVELNKLDAIGLLRNRIKPDQPIEVVPLRVKYPQGAEKMLIKSLTGMEVPSGGLPRDIGINVNNVGTLVAIADYFDTGMPLIERVITVSGPGVAYPANVLVPLGTPVRKVLRFCGGLKDTTREVIMGGPMMGTSLATLDVPILKGTSGLLAFTQADTRHTKEMPCVRCGRCVEACPQFLNPSRLARLARKGQYEQMKQYYITDCVECGCCTFSCPSGIPIIQLIRIGKNELKKGQLQ